MMADIRKMRNQKGGVTVSFVLTVFWLFIILFVFIQMANIGYTWQVTGYAAYASARSRIVGKLFNGEYQTIGENVIKRSLPPQWGSVWIVQELPLGIGVVIISTVKVLGIPIPVLGRAEVPYSKLNPFDPDHYVWSVGDNN